MKKIFLFGKRACSVLRDEGIEALCANLECYPFIIKEYEMPDDYKKAMRESLKHEDFMEISKDDLLEIEKT